MMEDAGEDVLRAKPSVVTTFFKRLGQVRRLHLEKMTKPLARSGSDVLGAVTVPKSFIHGWEITGVPQYASVGLAFNGHFYV